MRISQAPKSAAHGVDGFMEALMATSKNPLLNRFSKSKIAMLQRVFGFENSVKLGFQRLPDGKNPENLAQQI